MDDSPHCAKGALNLNCIRLIDLIDAGLVPADCDIAHYNDGDAPHATVVDLCKDNLTEEGRREWSDVLELRISSIRSGFGDTPFIHLTGENTERLMDRVKDFVLSFAGYCSEEDYDKWFETGNGRDA